MPAIEFNSRNTGKHGKKKVTYMLLQTGQRYSVDATKKDKNIKVKT